MHWSDVRCRKWPGLMQLATMAVITKSAVMLTPAVYFLSFLGNGKNIFGVGHGGDMKVGSGMGVGDAVSDTHTYKKPLTTARRCFYS